MIERLDNGNYSIPYQEEAPIEPPREVTIHKITPIEDKEVRTFRIKELPQNQKNYEFSGLREAYHKIPIDLYLKAGKCEEILYWDLNTQYCGACGEKTKFNTEISKICPKCGKEIWPQLAIAIIVLIQRGDEVLLVHAKNFRGNYYGLVAGFVETGETLEEAVHREVEEETGLKIKNLKYFGSQPWPYPSGLMVGFNAEYLSGEIKLQDAELSSGGWFKKENMPAIPDKLSIARRLIDCWLKK